MKKVFFYLRHCKREYLGISFILSIDTVVTAIAGVLCFLYGIGRADMYSNLASPLLIILSVVLLITSIFNGFAAAKAFKRAIRRK